MPPKGKQAGCDHRTQTSTGTNEWQDRVTRRDCGKLLYLHYPRQADSRLVSGHTLMREAVTTMGQRSPSQSSSTALMDDARRQCEEMQVRLKSLQAKLEEAHNNERRWIKERDEMTVRIATLEEEKEQLQKELGHDFKVVRCGAGGLSNGAAEPIADRR